MCRSTLRLAAASAFAFAFVGATHADPALLLTNCDISPAFGRTGATSNNDFPGAPIRLRLGQLEATANGEIDFFYLGKNEACYTNWLKLDASLLVDGSVSHSTYGQPADFRHSSYGESISVDTEVGTSSSLWGLQRGDSGVRNDDDIALARFRPVSVPEPATVSLLGIGLLGLAAAKRRSSR